MLRGLLRSGGGQQGRGTCRSLGLVRDVENAFESRRHCMRLLHVIIGQDVLDGVDRLAALAFGLADHDVARQCWGESYGPVVLVGFVIAPRADHGCAARDELDIARDISKGGHLERDEHFGGFVRAGDAAPFSCRSEQFELEALPRYGILCKDMVEMGRGVFGGAFERYVGRGGIRKVEYLVFVDARLYLPFGLLRFVDDFDAAGVAPFDRDAFTGRQIGRDRIGSVGRYLVKLPCSPRNP